MHSHSPTHTSPLPAELQLGDKGMSPNFIMDVVMYHIILMTTTIKHYVHKRIANTLPRVGAWISIIPNLQQLWQSKFQPMPLVGITNWHVWGRISQTWITNTVKRDPDLAGYRDPNWVYVVGPIPKLNLRYETGPGSEWRAMTRTNQDLVNLCTWIKLTYPKCLSIFFFLFESIHIYIQNIQSWNCVFMFVGIKSWTWTLACMKKWD